MAKRNKTDDRQIAGRAGGQTTEAKGADASLRRLIPVALPQLAIPTDAKKMAEVLERYATELHNLAEQLRTKDGEDTIQVPWPPPIIMTCNGGGE